MNYPVNELEWFKGGWFTFLIICLISQKALALLLKQGAEVNARDKFWQTPLHVAAANRATRCAEALIPHLSSLNVADRSGRTALHHAAHSGHLEVSEGSNFRGFVHGILPAPHHHLRCEGCLLKWLLCCNLCSTPQDGESAPEQRGQPECQ